MNLCSTTSIKQLEWPYQQDKLSLWPVQITAKQLKLITILGQIGRKRICLATWPRLQHCNSWRVCVCVSLFLYVCVLQVFVRLIASCLHIFHTHFAQFSSKLIESFLLILLLLLFDFVFFSGLCVNDMLTAASGALELMSIISQSLWQGFGSLCNTPHTTWIETMNLWATLTLAHSCRMHFAPVTGLKCHNIETGRVSRARWRGRWRASLLVLGLIVNVSINLDRCRPKTGKIFH